jgi:small subunit ribosomal protein S1
VGKVIEGTVERAGQPGVFVSLEPGLTGLIPISELSLPPGSDPARAHAVGSKLLVRVLSLDAQRKRIALSHEAAKAAAERDEYLNYAGEPGDAGNEGESAMALAFRRAMEKKGS